MQNEGQGESVFLSVAQKDELDRRLLDCLIYPENGDSWENVKDRILWGQYLQSAG